MRNAYQSLLFACLLGAGTAAAQTPASGPLHAAQTIALGPTTALGGTVVLPNHNTVLFLTDTEQPTMRAQCLAPDGHTLWETTVDRYQHPKTTGLFATADVPGRTPDEIHVNAVKRATSLLPLDVITEGNNVVLVERIRASAVKKLPANSPFQAGQLYVQRLDEQGHLTKAHFEPQPPPAVAPLEADAVLGRYADATGYVEIVRQTDYPKRQKERTQAFFLDHYDLGATAVRREPMALPPTTWLTGSWDMFRLWYQDWAYLGHRPNQTYFCRRLLVNSAKERAGDQPLSFQIYIVDDHGAVAPGGFSTTLGLSKKTSPAYCGAIPNYGELDYAQKIFTTSTGAYESTSYDTWEMTGVGSFYLDHGTGDVLIFGEYGEGDLPTPGSRPDLLGFYEQRYTFDGKLLDRLQSQYSKTLLAHKKAGSFVGQVGRRVQFHLDPLTGQSQYSFSPMHVMGSGEDFDLVMDQHLKMERVEYIPGSDRSDYLFTTVTYTTPYWLHKGRSTATTEQRRYAHAAPTDPPIYAALEKLTAAAGPLPFHAYHLSPTGPTTGLVVERREGQGGTLQVYTF